MKVLQTAVALVPVAVMVGLQGCGGADGNPGPSADKCEIKNKHTAANPQLKDIECEAVSTECCAVVNKDVKIIANKDGKDGMTGANKDDNNGALASVGKCGRNDQVGLFKCIKAAAAAPEAAMEKQDPGLKLCSTAPAVGEGADGDGTCEFKAGGKGFSVPGVSTGCCTAMKNVAAAAVSMKGAMKGSMNGLAKQPLKSQQKDVDAFCGLVGACGRKDQEGIMKFGEGMKGKGKGKGGAPITELLATIPPTESMLGQDMMDLLGYLPPMPAFEEFPETEALEAEPISQAGMAASGFIAGAAFTGLGLVALNRNKESPLAEPLTA